tara:strand:+ start:3372 stop:3845 length:474 start_codon:yes stop_codon:yes gene_type:complete
MLIEFQNYLTFQNIFLWTNFGIIPFWLLLIFMPNYKITQILINSIILPLILSSLYVYLVYQATLLDESIFDIFKLYLSLDNLYTVFATESFLLIFWIHFVSINLFLGSWVSRDSIKYNIPKVIAFLSLVSIYFAGPIGLVIYWFFRVFFAKRLGFHD